MTFTRTATALAFAATAALSAQVLAGEGTDPASKGARPALKNVPSSVPLAKGKDDPRVKRGAYLVWIGGCHDCHTPLTMGPEGPTPDFSRALSGHPADMPLPPAPTLPPGPWMATVAATLTAWSGPWGTSFTANLTPDKETGLGSWTADNFIETMRTGKHQGRGRKLLPPMPYQNLAGLTDDDLRAVFAFLQAIPPVKNRVPQPLPPPAPPATAKR